MQYVGEHLWAADLGRGLTALSFVFALLSTLAYYLKGDQWKLLGRLAFRIHAISLFGLIGTLFYIMAHHYFEFDYVWKHTSLDLPPQYLFSAFWEGQEGSFLLWMFWNAILGYILTYSAKKFEGPVVGVDVDDVDLELGGVQGREGVAEGVGAGAVAAAGVRHEDLDGVWRDGCFGILGTGGGTEDGTAGAARGGVRLQIEATQVLLGV